MGASTRRQAPEAEVSSIVAGKWQGVPVGSFHEISATAHIGRRASMLHLSMPCVSARRLGS